MIGEWIRLEHRAGDDPRAVVREAAATGLPLDVSSNPALWGEALHGVDCPIVVRGGRYELGQATSQEHAADLMGALLISLLCSLRRDHIEIFVLEVPVGAQKEGALEALEEAKREGHVGEIRVEES